MSQERLSAPTPPGRCASCGAALVPLEHVGRSIAYCPSTKCARYGRMTEEKSSPEEWIYRGTCAHCNTRVSYTLVARIQNPVPTLTEDCPHCKATVVLTLEEKRPAEAAKP